MKYSKDYYDLINHNYYSLWERYKPLMMVYFKKIPHKIRFDLYNDEGFEEFTHDCYIVLVNAVNGLDPEKIKNKTTWSFHIQFSQWLHNFTTRNIIRDYCNKFAIHYEDYTTIDDDGDELRWEFPNIDHHSNLQYLLDLLSPRDREAAENIMFKRRGTHNISNEGKRLISMYYSLF